MTPISTIARRLLKSVPAVDRVGVSANWLLRMARLASSPNRVFLSIPPGHFYSPLPDSSELERDAARIYQDSGPDLPGVILGRAEQIALAAEISRYESQIPFGGESRPGLRYCFENVYFPYADGATLFAMLRHLRPARVVEVGSGHSSGLMLDTDQLFLGGRTQFTFIDPDTARLDTMLADADRDRCRVFADRVQGVPLGVFEELRDGDLLFIDSSHVSKIGSDVNYLFFEILPRLPAGVVVHVHDIFWPFEYPLAWLQQGRAWNEAYLLRSLLCGGDRYKILLFPSYLEVHAAMEWEAALPTARRRAASNPSVGAGSIYLRVVAL